MALVYSVSFKFPGHEDYPHEIPLSDDEHDELGALLADLGPFDSWTSYAFSREEPNAVEGTALFRSASAAMEAIAEVRSWAAGIGAEVEAEVKKYDDEEDDEEFEIVSPEALKRPIEWTPAMQADYEMLMDIVDEVEREMEEEEKAGGPARRGRPLWRR